jgi:hypothetical protein
MKDFPTKKSYIDWLLNKIVRDFKNKTIILDAGIREGMT